MRIICPNVTIAHEVLRLVQFEGVDKVLMLCENHRRNHANDGAWEGKTGRIVLSDHDTGEYVYSSFKPLTKEIA